MERFDGKIISKIIKFEIKSFQMFQKRDETPQSSSQPHQQFINSNELTIGTINNWNASPLFPGYWGKPFPLH